jgi:hypothetical protein
MKVDLEAVEKRGAALARGQWRRSRLGAADVFVLREAGQDAAQLHAPEAVGEAVMKAGEDLTALVAEVRRLQGEVQDAQSRAARSAPAARTGPPPPLDEEASVLLAAPFHVGPKVMKAAQTDPLVALAVQAARATQPDAKEIERARLIAMALAATTGDMEAFWAARRRRGGTTAKGKATRKK